MGFTKKQRRNQRQEHFERKWLEHINKGKRAKNAARKQAAQDEAQAQAQASNQPEEEKLD
jgi:hypothetical protein